MLRTDANWAIPLTSLLGAGTVLGLSTNLAKLADGAGLGPLAFLAWSVVGAAIVLTGIGTVRHRLPPLDARTTEYFVVAGLIGLAAPNLLSFAAVSHLGAGFVALSITFSPLFTYLGALFLGIEQFRFRRAEGVVLALGGAVLLGVLKLSEPDVGGFWLVATFSAPVLLILAQTAVFSVMYLLYFVLQKHGGPVYLSFLGSVAAVVGVPIAVLILGEAPPQGLFVGGVLIALGIVLVTLGDPKAASSANLSSNG
jgi:drug/metabolite transporter (DMT)-like permease